jgi:hypothetical protein
MIVVELKAVKVRRKSVTPVVFGAVAEPALVVKVESQAEICRDLAFRVPVSGADNLHFTRAV